MSRSYAPFVALLLMDGVGPGPCSRLPVEAEEVFDRLHSDDGRRWLSAELGVKVREIPWPRFDKMMAAIDACGAEVLTIQDAGYPAHLREIDMPPPLLFYRGDVTLFQKLGIAIVGTRAATARGARFAYTLAGDLAATGVTIVSGMARGIDTAAHQGALDRDGRTIAVMGTGIDMAYPTQNTGLMEQIAEHGCVVSEQLPGTPPLRHVFPLRNRLISGSSHAVIVVEAARRSGALVTARWALEQGRDVGAVPGFPGDPRSKGANSLIKSGAFAVESVEDVFEAIPNLGHVVVSARKTAKKEAATIVSMNDDELALLAAIGPHTVDPDMLVDRLDISIGVLQRTLVQLELRGALARDTAGFYYRTELELE